jgi:Protein of unknown function DUF262
MPLQEPKLYTLNEVLHDRLFRVPPYQRGYSWTRKEREDLFQDLRNVRDLRRDEHFMATLVFRDTGKHVTIGGADRLRIYDVVDGQQRLTTLVVLFKAVEKNLKKNAQEKQAEKLNAILVKEKKNLILLQTNHDACETLDTYLRSGELGELEGAKTLHQRELMNAFRECERFVADWGNPISLLDLLKNNIKFVFFVLENPGAVYTVFEALNSRGLTVDWLDKMKSTLMGIAFQKKRKLPINELDNIENEWTEIYRILGRQRVSDGDVLTIAANLQADEAPAKGFQEWNALEFFREETRQDRLTPWKHRSFYVRSSSLSIIFFKTLAVALSVGLSSRGFLRPVYCFLVDLKKMRFRSKKLWSRGKTQCSDFTFWRGTMRATV